MLKGLSTGVGGQQRRLSLEDAMKKEKKRLSISDKDGEIVLERTSFASRKRGRVCTVTSGSAPLSLETMLDAHGKSPSAETKFWREKFEQLQRERFEEEEDLERLLEVTLEKEVKLMAYAKLLEQKIDLLLVGEVEGASSSSSGTSTAVARDSSECTDLYAKIDQQRKLLRFYELMTSMTVRTDDETEFVCTLKNKVKRLVTRFVVKSGGDDANPTVKDINSCENMQFVPRANVELLPEYLHGRVEFPSDSAPVMLGDTLQALFADDDEEEKEGEEEEGGEEGCS